MFLLKEEGYHVLPLCRAIERMYNDSLEKNSIVITFDDGPESILENAVSCLLELYFPASIFVPTGLPGQIVTAAHGNKRKRVLDWDQLALLHKNGIDIHSHSVSHKDLTTLGLEQLEYELRHSLETMRLHFGDRDYYLAYPFGMVNQDVLDMVRTVEYKGAFCFGNVLSNWRHTDAYQLKRERVLSTTTIQQFHRKIDTSYDLIRFAHVHSAHQLERLLKMITSKVGAK